MNVKITMSGPGGELDSTILEGIIDYTDDRITDAVNAMCMFTTWAVGDTLTVTEIEP